ncbi:MAG: sugar phosphate isomerase/epimerase family protein [Hyphomicrobiaceae bacterium]
MAHTIPKLCVITDETGPRLDTCLAFAKDEGLDAIEVRQVDGINPLSLTPAQLDSAVARVGATGLAVAGIATPLFKWPRPGQSIADLGDQFGFDRAGRSDEQLFADAIRVSDAFGTKNLRIFSFLTYEGFSVEDLRPGYETLLDLAEKHDKYLLVENEFVCNIARMDQFAELMAAYDSPRLRPLPDIANSAWVGETPSMSTLEAVMQRADHIHFKDYAASAQGFVTLGEGDVDVRGYIQSLLTLAGERQLTFSIETHAKSEPLENTRRSLNHLRQVLADLDA